MRTENKDKELNHRHFIGLRLTDVELDLLDQGAACLSISRSEYLRKLLLEKQINHQIEVVADMNDLRKLVSEYGKIGSNLNQIAKHFNKPPAFVRGWQDRRMGGQRKHLLKRG